MDESKPAPAGQRNTKAVCAHYAGLAATYDDKANLACKRAYAGLVRRTLGHAQRILEVGAGSSPLLSELCAFLRVASDLSLAMLTARPLSAGNDSVVSDAEHLPFADQSFDAVFCINAFEHILTPALAVAEAARVLVPGGRFLTVTPNGDAHRLLELLERLHLKLPEGPHHFLTFDALESLAGDRYRILEHRRFLAFPVGPPAFVRAVDRLVSGRHGRGLFQYLLLERV